MFSSLSSFLDRIFKAQKKPLSFSTAKTTRPYAPFPSYFSILNLSIFIFDLGVIEKLRKSCARGDARNAGGFFTHELSEYFLSFLGGWFPDSLPPFGVLGSLIKEEAVFYCSGTSSILKWLFSSNPRRTFLTLLAPRFSWGSSTMENLGGLVKFFWLKLFIQRLVQLPLLSFSAKLELLSFLTTLWDSLFSKIMLFSDPFLSLLPRGGRSNGSLESCWKRGPETFSGLWRGKATWLELKSLGLIYGSGFWSGDTGLNAVKLEGSL